MPTYEYRCKDCSHELEVQQSFQDDPLTECPSCGGELRKKFSAVGISFKGSGFYKNDARGSGPSSSGGGSGSSPSSSSSDSTGASGDSAGSSSSSSSSSSGGDSAATPAAPSSSTPKQGASA